MPRLKTSSVLLILLFSLYLIHTSALESTGTGSTPSPPSPNRDCIVDGFYNCSPQCPCNYNTSYFSIAIIIISFLSVLWSTFFFIGFFLVKELRQKPGEIIFILAITNFFLGIKYIFEGIKLSQADSSVGIESDNTCQTTGSLNMLLINIINLYQLTFYCYKILTLQSPIKASSIGRRYYHLITIILTLLLTGGTISYGAIGKTILGICALKTSSNGLIPVLVYGLFFSVIVILGCVMRKSFSQRSKDLNRKEAKFVEHYIAYLIMLGVVQVLIGAIELDINLRIGKSLNNSNVEKSRDAINTIEILVFGLINLNPFVLFIARIRDPAVLKPFRNRFYEIFCCRRPIKKSQRATDAEEGKILENQELLIEQNSSTELKTELLADETNNYHTLRSSQPNPWKVHKTAQPVPIKKKDLNKRKDPKIFYSTFAGVYYFWHKQRSIKSESLQDLEKRDKSDVNYYKKLSTKTKKFTLHESLLKNGFPHLHREIRSKSYKVRFGIFTAFAPSLFDDLIEFDGVENDLSNSIDLSKNLGNITVADTPNRTQFITYDSKFLFRSISKGERRTLMRMMPNYLKYLKSRPYSLLARIYGVYRFEVLSPYKQVNWLVMKNSTERSGPNIERMYDLTGVNLDRQTPLPEVETGIDILKEMGPLGDDYYETFEKGFNIQANVRNTLLDALNRDIEFLKREKLLGYSLNIRLVNRIKVQLFQQRLSSSVILEVEESMEDKSVTVGQSTVMFRENSEEEEKSSSDTRKNTIEGKNGVIVSQVRMQNPFYALKSTKEHLHYGLEIDNFLHYYDWKKKIRAIFDGCVALENRIQPPSAYGDRLLEYSRRVINNNEALYCRGDSEDDSSDA